MSVAFAQDPIVTEYQGDGIRNTRPFTVDAGWEIQWTAQGDVFQLYLHDASGELVGVAANQSGPGSGASYQAAAGRYYLQVNAIGTWTIRIVDLEDDAATGPATSDAPIEYTGSGAANTRPFETAGAWELQWSAGGDLFQVYLYTEDGDLVDVAANQSGPGPGASYQPRGGRYYLQVNALGPWTIRVVPLP
ncbi:MAG: hypothetical protein U5K81_13725 [Trueperaceae bacterium]|nr:hypothetical protein [Trueperaceae bacterium]